MLLLRSADNFAQISINRKADRPNILLILVDDLRSDAAGVMGHPFFNSPNIDRLAFEGARFRHAFATHSLCSPSRATILTGLYSHVHRVVDNSSPLDRKFPSVPQILQAAGYETAFIGKWHMGHTDANPRSGFTHWISFAGQGEYINPIINVDGQEAQIAGHVTDILTSYTLEFLSGERRAPFFLILSHKAVHSPLTPQDRFKGIYNKAHITFPLTWGEDLSSKPSFLQYHRDTGNLEDRIRLYLETLAGVDESVGKILTKLQEKNLLDDTLIIFTSDNGMFLGEHNLRDKRLAYEESIRIPLILRYPAWFAAGLVPEQHALNLDIASTILEAANINDLYRMQGISLHKLANGEAQRQIFLYEYFWDPAFPNTPAIRAIRTRDYKYVTYLKVEETDELYDLKKDSIEANNLVNDTNYSAILRRLKWQLDSLRIATEDAMTDTSVDAPNGTIPKKFAMQQNYPNPFNAGTRIDYGLPEATPVSLKIFNSLGHEVAILIDEKQPAGLKSVRFNASGYASGIYFYRLVSGSFIATKKMIIMK
ncbi:sulfatase-like hydrolase/transferase [candidate division KSB1 bacterium]|nr:sulfatase-like hydrolase/transferase [candidate division KSB1 bacterium]